jgi:hypothetical protein
VCAGLHYLVIEICDLCEKLWLVSIHIPDLAEARDAEFDVVHVLKAMGQV